MTNAITSDVSPRVNDTTHQPTLDNRRTLLDAIREDLGRTGPKRRCDHGQCGARTVLLDDRRAVSCLILAVSAEGASVTTIEGIAGNDGLWPIQEAFLRLDGFPCGFCTPGQICSAVGMPAERAAGWISAATSDVVVTGELSAA